MDSWVGKVAVVTGASSAVGAAIVERLVKAGLKVVGFARKSDPIEEHAKALSRYKGKLRGCVVDMGDGYDIRDGFDWTKNNLGALHILVNNTGFVDKNTSEKELMDTPMAIATMIALDNMNVDSIDSHVVNITCTDVDRKIHDILVKKLEVLSSKIKMTSVSVGLLQTNILHNSDEFMKTVINNVADGVMYALSTPPHVQVPELTIEVVEEKF